MKAVGKFIVIEDLEEKTTETKGGLLLDEKNREDIRYKEAKVLITGQEVTFISKGDKVFYDKHAGFIIEINKESHKVIKEQDVVIVL